MNKENQIVIYQTAGGKATLEVNLREEFVWLGKYQMRLLFDRDYNTVAKHIINVFKEGELEKVAVVANFATTATDGKTYQVEHYNLDVIISAGYRVKSKRGTRFRIRETNVLRKCKVEDRGTTATLINHNN